MLRRVLSVLPWATSDQIEHYVYQKYTIDNRQDHPSLKQTFRWISYHQPKKIAIQGNRFGHLTYGGYFVSIKDLRVKQVYIWPFLGFVQVGSLSAIPNENISNKSDDQDDFHLKVHNLKGYNSNQYLAML
jgi:hypothetical protein